MPPNLDIVPKFDMKHCLTNSKRRHIGAKGSVLWPSKYAKMRFQWGLRSPPWTPLGKSRRSPDPLVGWGIPPHTFSTQRLNSLAFGANRSEPLCPDLEGHNAPTYFFRGHCPPFLGGIAPHISQGISPHIFFRGYCPSHIFFRGIAPTYFSLERRLCRILTISLIF